jgi:hypothetical protein
MVDPNFTPITICDRKPSPSVLYQCKRSMAIVFLACLCASVSICGTEQAQTMEQPNSSIIKLQCNAFTGGKGGI